MNLKSYLVVGDPHGEPHDLDDLKALFGLIRESLVVHPEARLILLGDQYHNHGVIHAEVQKAWWDLFESLKSPEVVSDSWEYIQFRAPIALTGNHDRPLDKKSRANAMMVHRHHCLVVDEPIIISEDILFLPYMDDNEAFKEACRAHPTHAAFCHQEFQGAAGDNGHVTGKGVDPRGLPQSVFISGHYHAPQELTYSFGRTLVNYVGAPRWRTQSDANVDRNIYLMKFSEESGAFLKEEAIPTSPACRRIHHLHDTPEAPLWELPKDGQIRIDVRGPAAWVTERQKLWHGLARVRSFVTDSAAPKIRQSEGVRKEFDRWLGEFKPARGTPVEVLKTMANARLKWQS